MPSSCADFGEKDCLLFISYPDLQIYWGIISPCSTPAEWVANSLIYQNKDSLLCMSRFYIFSNTYILTGFYHFPLKTNWKFTEISLFVLKIFNPLSYHLKPLVFPEADGSMNHKMTYLLLRRKKMRRKDSITRLKFKSWIPWGKITFLHRSHFLIKQMRLSWKHLLTLTYIIPSFELTFPSHWEVSNRRGSMQVDSFFISWKERGLFRIAFLFDLLSIKKTPPETRAQSMPLTQAKPHSRSRSIMAALRIQILLLLYLRSKFPLMLRLY